MTRPLLLILATLASTPIASFAAQPAAPPAANIGPTLTSATAQSDFDLLRRALEEAHPGLYRYTPKPQMDRALDAQRAKLAGPLGRYQFEAVIAETLALLHCGHTSMNPDDQFESAAKAAKTLPLRVILEGPRLMIMLNDTAADSTLRPGMQLLEINGHKVDALLARFYSVLSADGDIQTGNAHDISGRFAKYYWWLIEQTDSFTIKAQDDSGHAITTTLPGVTESERRSNHNPINAALMAGVGKVIRWSKDELAFRFLKDPDIAEIRFNHFLGNNFPSYLANTFKTLHDRHTRSLIIDLRGNGGGEDEYGSLLVSYLTDKPFRYFDRIEVKSLSPTIKDHLDWSPNFESKLRGATVSNPAGGYLLTPKMNPGLNLQQPAQSRFLGKVFILTDGGSFSCSADVCAILHHLKRATFIGEETGGAYYGNNSGAMPDLTLPNSKISIRFPLYAYWNAVSNPKLARRGTPVDFDAPIRTTEVMRGTDGGLDLALKLAAR